MGAVWGSASAQDAAHGARDDALAAARRALLDNRAPMMAALLEPLLVADPYDVAALHLLALADAAQGRAEDASPACGAVSRFRPPSLTPANPWRRA